MRVLLYVYRYLRMCLGHKILRKLIVFLLYFAFETGWKPLHYVTGIHCVQRYST